MEIRNTTIACTQILDLVRNDVRIACIQVPEDVPDDFLINKADAAAMQDVMDDFSITKSLPNASEGVSELLDLMDVAAEGLISCPFDTSQHSFKECCYLVAVVLQGPPIMLLTAPCSQFIVKTDFQILQCRKLRFR